MLGNLQFYNRTIRKVVVAFGTLFNDIQLQRYTKDGVTTKEIFKVPLSYGSKEKYLTRLLSDPTLTKSISTTVPRISFEMGSMAYDASRKLPTTIRNFSANTSTTVDAQYAPIPYNFDFSLSIFVRNTEDGTQILEQILPFFTPDFTVTVNFIPNMDQKYDMPIILNSVENQMEYEGDLSTTRLIIWNLTFTAKGYIWPPVKTKSVIRQANTNIFIETQSRLSQKVFVDFANGIGKFSDTEIINVPDRGVSGKLKYFSNNTNGVVIVDNLNKFIQVGDRLTGFTTNSRFTVTSVDISPVKSISTVITTNPANADPDDEFGFSESTQEWPNT